MIETRNPATLHKVFNGEIPETWERAKTKLQERGMVCSKSAYLEALTEQELSKYEG